MWRQDCKSDFLSLKAAEAVVYSVKMGSWQNPGELNSSGSSVSEPWPEAIDWIFPEVTVPGLVLPRYCGKHLWAVLQSFPQLHMHMLTHALGMGEQKSEHKLLTSGFYHNLMAIWQFPNNRKTDLAF